MRSARSRLFAALVAPLLVVALAGCGGDTSGSDDKAGGSSAGDAAPDGLSAGDEVDPADFLATIKAGVDKSTTATMKMTMTAAGMDITADGQLDYTTTPPEMSVEMMMPMLGEVPIDLRIVGGNAYVNMGAMTGDKFVMSSVDDPDGPLGDMSEFTDSFDPVQSMENLGDGFSKVVYVGQDSLDGDDVAHYAVTVDTSKTMGDALDSLGSSSGAGTLPEELTYDAWFDGDNRIRKIDMKLGDMGSLTMEVSGWGEDVSIEAPPSDQITDSADLSGLGG